MSEKRFTLPRFERSERHRLHAIIDNRWVGKPFFDLRSLRISWVWGGRTYAILIGVVEDVDLGIKDDAP